MRVSLFTARSTVARRRGLKQMQRTALEMRRAALVHPVLSVLRVETGQHHICAIGERDLELRSVLAPIQIDMV